MKSKFLPLVKYKEQKVEAASAKIVETGRQIGEAKERIVQHKEVFLNRELPTEGNIHFFAQQQLLNVAFKQELNQLEAHLRLLEGKKRDEEIILKQERIEQEKFSMLHQDDIQKQLKRLKKAEADFLDEMGTIRFANKIEG
jgi:hypothetical protein